jgi:lysozyme
VRLTHVIARAAAGRRHRTLVLATVAALTPAPASAAEPAVQGLDVSDHQGPVNWQQAWVHGARFAYIKATEGTTFHSRSFDRQYGDARAAGLLRGAYHIALPDRSSGTVQARYFVDHGGGWGPDGQTLPGALDMENNPYGAACYGLAPPRMVRWLTEFTTTYRDRVHREPVIYTTTAWWNRCTGGNRDFAAHHPLWLARYAAAPGPLPAGWSTRTFWQYADTGRLPGDQDSFNGTLTDLRHFAGSPPSPPSTAGGADPAAPVTSTPDPTESADQ